MVIQDAASYVSIVMTSYNRAHYIGQAIDSILAQKCNFPFEIIIGDDCSSDNSRALLQSYKDKYPEIFVLNLQQKNVGFGPNWASTCKLARGKYIAFLDDDDYWCDESRLQEMVDTMEADHSIGLVYTNRYILDVESGEKHSADISMPEGVDMVDYLHTKGFPILFSTSMIRKSLMDAYVNLEDYIRLKFPVQDWPTAMLIAPHCRFKYLEKPSVVYRSYLGSMSKPQTYEQIIKKYAAEKVSYAYVMDKLHIPFDEPGWDCYVNHLLLSLAYNRGDYKEAKFYAKQLDMKSIKILCAHNRLLFHLFRFGKHLKKMMWSNNIE